MSDWPDVVLLLASRCLYLGLHLTTGQSDAKADQMAGWTAVVPLLVTRCLSWGVHLTTGHLTKVVTHMPTRCVCLGERVSLTFFVIGSQPASHMTRYQPVRLWVGQIFGDREGQVDILFDRQSASLPAAIGQPTTHMTRYQPVKLWVGQIFGGRRTGSLTTLGPCPGSQHSHWFPLGSDLPDQGKASDTNELYSLLYTFGTMFRDHLQFCIYTT